MRFYTRLIDLLRSHSSLFYILAFGLLLMAFSLSLPDRKPHIDDAWLGEHSYWLYKDGVAKSKLMTGIAGSEDRLLLHHKLFTMQGAGIIAFFGFQLHWLKAVSLVYLALTIMLLFRLQKTTGIFSHKASWPILLLIFISNPLIFEFGFVFRPETMLMFFGLCSYYFLFQSIQQTNRIPYLALLSGVFAGLALSTHLNGAIFIAAGFLLLLVRIKLLPALFFAGGSVIGALLYFYDFRSLADFSLWYAQLTFIPSNSNELHPLLKPLYHLSVEHMRYFHSPKEIIFSVLLIVTVLGNYKKLWQLQRPLLLYTVFLMVSLAALALNKTSKYLIPLMPYFLMIIVYGIEQLLSADPARALRRYGWVLSAYFMVSVFYNLQVVQSKHDPGLNRQIREAFAGNESRQMKVLAPMVFIFNEIDHFESVISVMSYGEQQKIDPDLHAENILLKAASQGIDLILLRDEDALQFGLEKYSLYEKAGGFRKVFEGDKLIVWSAELNNYPPLVKNSVEDGYNNGLLYYSGAFN